MLNRPKLSVALCLLVITFSSNATVKQELSALKQQVERLQKQIALLEQKVAEEKTITNEIKPSSATKKAKQIKANSGIKLYATLRPTFGYLDEKTQQQFDVRDALSHAGFKATTRFSENWKAILHGEWGIDLSNNGDFGKARQVYVALDSPYGRVGIGKQRPVQYLFIAEYVDIFNHGLSPFAYDPESLFFVNNLVTYQKKLSNFTFMAVAQFNGENGDNYQDLFNTGISYDNNNLHLAATYTTQDALYEGNLIGQDKIWALSAAYQFESGLYAALGYQDKKYDRNNTPNRDGHTVDLSFAYPLGDHHKVKTGFFSFEDGHLEPLTKDYEGYNVTLEWLPTKNLRFHIEYLDKNYEQLPDFSSISIGFRYDYAQLWQY